MSRMREPPMVLASPTIPPRPPPVRLAHEPLSARPQSLASRVTTTFSNSAAHFSADARIASSDIAATASVRAIALAREDGW